MKRELVQTDDGVWMVFILDENNTIVGFDQPTEIELKDVENDLTTR